MPNSPQSMVVCTRGALSMPYIPHLPSFTPPSGPHGVPLPLPFPFVTPRHPTPNIFTPSHLHSFTPSLLLILFVAVDLLQRCRCRCPLPVRIPPYPHHASDLALAEARRSSRALPNASRLPAPDSSPIQGTRVARTGCSLRTDGQSFDVVLLRRRLCE